MEPPFRTWIGFPAKQAVESSTSADNAIPEISISAQPLTGNQYFMCDMQANPPACVYVYRFGNGDCLCFPRSHYQRVHAVLSPLHPLCVMFLADPQRIAE